MEKVRLILEQYLTSGDRLIVGVSGGPDSTALLDIVVQYFKTLNPIIIAHVNHGIRGKAADADEKFVRQLAKSYGLKCEVKRVKLAGKTHQEEIGRKVRREFFEKLCSKYKAKWILTAHTQDDQIETIVFNFLRGAGPAGLAGMKTANGFYLKPLLTTTKSQILAFLKARKLKYCQDKTNEDTRLRRVFIRKKILPLLFEFNPAFKKNLLRNSVLFAAVNEWLKKEAQHFLEQHQKGRSLFPLKEYERLPDALKLQVIQEAYCMTKKSSYNLPFIKVNEICRMLSRRIGNKKIMLPGGGGAFHLRKGTVEHKAF